MDKAIVPEEALAYLKAKGLKVGFHHADVWKEEHNIAFTVAKMMQLDMLQDVKDALTEALEDGQTFSQFAANLKPYLIKKGWWGEQLARDPIDGDIKAVKLGSNARLKTIYRTNMRTARAAGQWKRIERTQTTHPFLLYQLGPSREHRKEHQAWAGIILPADHPWWQTHMPPNGWGCKCRVRQLSQREADRLIASGQYRTEAPPIEERDWVNRRTGEVERVPRGIDPGWSYHPGSRKEEIRRQFQKTQQEAL